RCQSAARPLVQPRKPATSIIVIDIPACLDCADAINDLPAVIEFKRYLGQAVQIAVWIRAHDELNLRFGEPYFDCRFHRTHQAGSGLVCRFHACWSLRALRWICYPAPNICLLLP